MASSLAAQLAQRSKAQNVQKMRLKDSKRPSLLFDPKTAADIDNDHILALACNGVQELARFDNRFTRFEAPLFSEQAKETNRELLTVKENAELDALLAQFLRILAPHFLLKSASKVLEWLIRRFKIHECNIDDIVSCAITYHETKLFVKLISLCRISNDSKWAFLRNVRNSGSPLDRSQLVQRCIKEPSFLEFICQMIIKTVEDEAEFGTLFTFYASLLVLYVQTLPKFTDATMNALLPTIVEGLKSNQSDFKIATYMILSQLSARVSLSGDAIDNLLHVMLQRVSSGRLTELMLCVIHICQSQNSSNEFSPRVLDLILQIPKFEEIFTAICKKYSVESFLMVLMRSLVRDLSRHQTHSDLLVALIAHEEVVLHETAVTTLSGIILEDYIKFKLSVIHKTFETESKSSAKDIIKRFESVLVALQNRCTECVDKALEVTLAGAAAQDSKNAKEVQLLLFEFVSKAFRGTSHELLEDSNTTLYLALHHADHSTRLLGLEKLDRMLQLGVCSDQDFVSDSLLTLLADDNTDVVLKALSVDSLPERVNTIRDLVRALGRFLLPDEMTMKVASIQKVQKRALEVLTSGVAKVLSVTQDDDTLASAETMLLANMLVTNDTHHVARVAIEGADEFSSVIFAGLKSIALAKLDAGKEGESQPALANVKLVEKLAQNINNCADWRKPFAPFENALIDNNKASSKLRVLALCVANRLLHSTAGEDAERFTMISNLLIDFYASQQYHAQSDTKALDADNHHGKPGPATLMEIFENPDSDLTTLRLELFTLANLVQCAPIVKNTVWLTRPIDADDVMTRNTLEKVFHRMMSASSTGSYDRVMSMMTRRHFKSGSLDFLINAFSGDTFDGVAKSRIIKIAKAVLKSSDNDAELDYQVMIPSLLVALSDKNHSVRSESIACLRVLSELNSSLSPKSGKDSVTVYKHDSFYGSTSSDLQFLSTDVVDILLEALLGSEDDLIADPESIFSLMQLTLSATSDRKNKKTELILTSLLSHIIADQNTASRAAKLTLLSRVNSPIVSKMLLPLSQKLQNQETFEPDVEAFLLIIAKSCSHDVTKSVFTDNKSGRQLFASFLNMLEKDEPASVQIAALDQIDFGFIDALGPSRKEELFRTMVSLICDGSSEVVRRVHKAWKASPPSAKLLAGELNSTMDLLVDRTTRDHDGASDAKRARGKKGSKLAKSIGAIHRLIAMLELLDYKPAADDDYVLVAPLFEALAALLDAELAEVPVSLEYVDQLVLAAITRVVADLAEKGPNASNLIDEASIRVDLVVQCIRVSDNPQTHNQSLLLMSAVATLYPDRVLNCIMPVFTFMGASVLRQDDNYSFHVVQQTVEKIIPPLVKAHQGEPDFAILVRPVIKIFVDALFHIPKHRRLRLFAVLISTLGEDEFLYAVISLLIEKYIDKSQKEQTAETQYLLEFCLIISSQFSASTQIKSAVALLESLLVLPHQNVQNAQDSKNADVMMISEGSTVPLYEPETHTDKHLRQFKLACLHHVEKLLVARPFLTKVVAAGQEDGDESLEGSFLRMAEQILSLTASVAAHQNTLGRGTDDNKSAVAVKFWKGFIKHAYDVMDKANNLLSLPSFISIVKSLMTHANATVRRKAISLFAAKVKSMKKMDEEEQTLVLSVIKPLCDVLSTGKESRETVAVNRQTTIGTLATLASRFARAVPDAFVDPIQIIVGDAGIKHSNSQVAASSLVCLAVFIQELGPRMVPSLPKFMPSVLEIVKSSIEDASALDSTRAVLQVSGLSVIETSAKTLPQFLNPYLPKVLNIILHSKVQSVGTATEGSEDVAAKSKDVRSAVATSVSPRVLLQPLCATFKSVVVNGKHSIFALFDMMAETITGMPRESITLHYKQIFKFFLEAFDTRRVHSDAFTNDAIAEIEDAIIDAFIQLVVKLNESLFKPLLLKTVDWGTSELKSSASADEYMDVSEEGEFDAGSRNRMIFTFRLVDRLLDRLKSIVAPYYGCVFECAVDQLKRYAASDREPDALWTEVMRSLHKSLIYDNDGFWNPQRFDTLLPHLVGQLENTHGDAEALARRAKEHTIPCLGQLAVTVGSDILWKRLNQQVLLCTRHDSVSVRLAALGAMGEFYARLGEEFLILLPETIPFLAELMEDDDIKVEKLTQEVIAQIETFLGESLQQYFK